jgi:hypothetical protein
MELEYLRTRCEVQTVRCFGERDSFDPYVRALRLLEESAEFGQAIGMTREKAHQLIDYVFSRKAGEPYQELGGVGMCWIVACTAMGFDPSNVALTEIQRIESKPTEHFAKRNQDKNDLGFGIESKNEPEKKEWRCYHCNEVFTDPAAAREHFGSDEYETGETPGCISPLRDDEKARLLEVSKAHEFARQCQQEAQESDEKASMLEGFQNELARFFGKVGGAEARTPHAAWLKLESTENALEAANLSLPNDLRQQGWKVAAHNDYHLNDVFYTFWLLTRGSEAVKGEGQTDYEALQIIRHQLKVRYKPVDVDKLKQALLFYANPNYYQPYTEQDLGPGWGKQFVTIMEDAGKQAREVLGVDPKLMPRLKDISLEKANET